MTPDKSVLIKLVSTSPEALDVTVRAMNSLYPTAHFGMLVKEDRERYTRIAWIRVATIDPMQLFEDDDTQPLPTLGG